MVKLNNIHPNRQQYIRVVYLETRVEKRKKRRKEKCIKILKLLVIFFVLLLFLQAVKIVNNNIVYLDYFENPKIFSLNFKESTLDLFGETYILDFKILKKLP